MTNTTVTRLAQVVGTTPEKLILQLNDAGVKNKGAHSNLSEEDKLLLLQHLRASHGNARNTVASMSHPSLKTTTNRPIPLKGVNININIIDLMSKVTVSQTYENTEDINIEAVYTFPMPVDAVLLDLSVTVDGRVLKGEVTEKSQAEADYEDSISDGDMAIMLEMVKPGMFTMNVGNLAPGSQVVITHTYGLLLMWDGPGVRFRLPTTIAPHYGKPEAMEPHQGIEHDPLVSIPSSLSLSITGHLADGGIESPTHKVSVSRKDGHSTLFLTDGHLELDRDFVVQFNPTQAQHSTFLLQPDGEKYIGLLSIKPDLGHDFKEQNKSFKFVIDCSGSMSGDSIRHAKMALIDSVRHHLQSADLFNIVAFGSTTSTLFKRQMVANEENKQLAFDFIRKLSADMGGTEMQLALKTAYALEGESNSNHDLLLITDGEAWDSDNAIRHDAKQSNHRLFTVGVGSAVSEVLVKDLAKLTDGACVLVTPNENMGRQIVFQFLRMRSPANQTIDITWPTSPIRQFPEKITAIFDGDTLHCFAWFDEPSYRDITVTIRLPNGFSKELIIEPSLDDISEDMNDGELSTLARIGASKRLDVLDSPEGAKLALDYQLMSAYTNYLVIDKQANEGLKNGLPALRKVPQMLAAGWGGHGSVVHKSLISFSRHSRSHCKVGTLDEVDSLDIHSDKTVYKKDDIVKFNINSFIDNLNDLPSSYFIPELSITTYDELEKLGVPIEFIDDLELQFEEEMTEKKMVILFLFLASTFSSKKLAREPSRAISKAYKALTINVDDRHRFEGAVKTLLKTERTY
ncbi:MAG: hypothetical protein AXW17_13200 [Colwellia sp. Phe_37]|nr:MAG: hypothetical protein AXW17_13200 [Colwellia sp. Phe_37]